MQLNRKIVYIIILITLLVSAISLTSYVLGLAKAVNSKAGEPVLVNVERGMSAQQIGSVLYEKGLIKNVTLFRLIARIQGMENSLQAGEYAFTQDMDLKKIIKMLTQGETAYYQFTVPEGYTIEQIAKLLEEKKLAQANKFKNLAKNFAPYAYISPRPEASYKIEGYVFPDTYRVVKGITEEQILQMMAANFDRHFTPALRHRANEIGLTVADVVILASLVEKEARVEEERPIIAAVFLNRLKQNMPLQSCATIQYILGYPKPELTLQDTELPSPYNTYQHLGLPPGPIANPGLAAIKAVLYPAETQYLYFVANSNGTHLFSTTYTEHMAAIEQVR